jgi:hypothetical protein
MFGKKGLSGGAMSEQLKCPHCATTVEYGVLVCYGCKAEAHYHSAAANEFAAAAGSGCAGLVFSAVIAAALIGGIWGDVSKAPERAMITAWVLVLLVAIVVAVLAYLVVRGKMSRTVTFRRRYSEGRVVELEVKLPGR